KGRALDLELRGDSALIHHHYESVEQYIDRLNRYTSVQAKLKKEKGYTFQWTDILKKPSNEFLSRYFTALGYKDGLHGLALSLLQGFSELIVYLKVWQLGKFEERNLKVDSVISAMKETESDMHYWQADTLLKEVGGLRH